MHSIRLLNCTNCTDYKQRKLSHLLHAAHLVGNLLTRVRRMLTPNQWHSLFCCWQLSLLSVSSQWTYSSMTYETRIACYTIYLTQISIYRIGNWKHLRLLCLSEHDLNCLESIYLYLLDKQHFLFSCPRLWPFYIQISSTNGYQ